MAEGRTESHEFASWFATIAGHDRPRPWQSALASDHCCQNRLIRIPTGMGKTLGVLAAWSFHRLVRRDPTWPRRLVWCLPMRTLVEQTEREAQTFLSRVDSLAPVLVATLMGGRDENRWYDDPEREAVLVGTQDMLLSRALNRGYAMGRAAWPRAFGLINSDTLWVMDEVQLMGVGLTTSGQIQSARDDSTRAASHPWIGDVDANEGVRISPPRYTWWMSATLQPQWLRTPETASLIDAIEPCVVRIDGSDRVGPVWDASKPVERVTVATESWAEHVIKTIHRSQGSTHDESDSASVGATKARPGRQCLVVVNTVKAAVRLYQALRTLLGEGDDAPDIRLLHGRFRPAERHRWADILGGPERLARDRVIVATQVIEAGVDISADFLVSELAPWTSLVQRFGRAARYGGQARVVVLDREPTDPASAAPYELHQLDAAREAIDELSNVSIGSIESFEQALRQSDPDRLGRLYPYSPTHVLLPQEIDELFDTSPDLSGADIDVSRFIREGIDRDVVVFWRSIPEGARPDPATQPNADELCAVPIGDAKPWVKKNSGEKRSIYRWDYLEGRWIPARADSLCPGMTLLADAKLGGYSVELGFTGAKPDRKAPSLDLTERRGDATGRDARDARDAGVAEDERAESTESLSQTHRWKTIATHAAEASQIAKRKAESLGLPSRAADLISLALRLHDWGKAHAAFAHGTYRVDPPRSDLAKAPEDAWRPLALFYHTPELGQRRGFRHELVSALATLEFLRRATQKRPGGNGCDAPPPRNDNDETTGGNRTAAASKSEAQGAPTSATEKHPIFDELSRLTPEDLDLLLFLIACHHGKVRASIQATALDQQFDYENPKLSGFGMPIRGVREGDLLPPVALPDADGNPVAMPTLTLSLAPAAIGLSPTYGRSWVDRVGGLLRRHGPFELAFLEAVARAADVAASKLDTPDPLLADVTLTVPPPVEPTLAAST